MYNRFVIWNGTAFYAYFRTIFKIWSVNITANLEIERKFLVELPDVSSLDVRRSAAIVQTYLRSGEDGSQRRVREIKENGSVRYTYTEKHFRTAVVRDENEREISAEEYRQLLLEANKDLVPVKKVRYAFEYMEQLFELDTYPFSETLAVMELELSDPEQEIYFPDNVKVIREVTAEKEYSNAALAAAGKFPDNAASAPKGDN